MKIPYGLGAYTRNRGNLPPLELINLFVEKSDSQGVILQSRKALVEVADVGAGPVRATFQKDGVFGGDRFTLSGDEFYRGATLLGTVAGGGQARIVSNGLEVLVNAGGAIYSYNGTDFVNAGFPEAAATTIAFTGRYFIGLSNGTGEWYFSGVNNGRSWDPLDFAEAENEPDALLDVLVLDGVLVFFGTESVEFWGFTGDPNLPYSPIQQRVFEQGIYATGCAVRVDNSFYWVGADKIVYRNGDVPQAVSDDGIVEKADGSTSLGVFALDDERHKFVCLRGDDFTMAHDVTTGQWCEFKSYGRTNFRAMADFGDDETGKIWAWGDYDDEGIIERLFMAGVELEQPAQIDNIRLTCEVGTTPNLVGIYTDPTLEMRFSYDAGNTWEDWEAEQLGEQGQYRQRVEWRALGMFDDPGALFQFRITDPVSFRLSDVQANAATGGRQR